MDIASFVIGVIALVVALMALPTIFQMLFGRPRLTFEADDFTGPDGRILVLAIRNPPVKNRFLRWMGVERETGDILGTFDIQELGSGKILLRAATGVLNCTPLQTIGPSARAIPGFTVSMTVIGTRNGVAHVVDGHQPVPIAPGHYVARIAICRGQDTYRIDQTFRIDSADYKTIWDKRDVVSIRQ